MKKTSRYLGPVLVAVALATLTSCGSDQGAPQLSRVQFSPDAITQATSPAGAPTTNIVQMAIKVLTPTGQTMSDTWVTVVASSGADFFQGFLTTPAEIAAATPYTQLDMKTDGFGSVYITARYPMQPPLDGVATIISAFTGAAFNRFNVTYECQSVPGVDCP